MRWHAGYDALERFNFVLKESCISREGYRSSTAIRAMRTLDDDLGGRFLRERRSMTRIDPLLTEELPWPATWEGVDPVGA